MAGILYGIGVGPGDPELITLKAKRLINDSDVLAYPAPETGDGLALKIVRSLLHNTPRLLPLRIPISLSSSPAHHAYDLSAKLLEHELDSGNSVAVICVGDPFFYGSFMYLFERISDRYKTEIIPGVSSPMACAAALKIPLVYRNEILTILPASIEESELENRILNTDAAAIIKVGRHLPKIRRVLRHLRLEKYSLYIEHATMNNQKIIQLEKIDSQKVPYFSMVLVRKIREQEVAGVK